MSGLVKAKKYDWKDSNLALFGSDTEKQVKKESAESEPAWDGAGKAEGVQIWRINQFKVEHWPKADYGKFYSGDSYIILNTYKDEKELKFDVHFWIGKESTQDEYGTAAYKTVELDTLLNDAAIQHREVENHESSLFKSYFKSIEYMRGGAATGFRHVKPEEYKPRLLKFSGTKKTIKVTEIPMCVKKIDPNDAYILDMGTQAILYKGTKCSKDESFKAVQYTQQLKSERNGKTSVETLEGDEQDDFLEKVQSIPQDDDDDDDDDDGCDDKTNKLLRISENGGDISMTLEHEGKISKGQLDTKDVFIVDVNKEVFVWCGRRCSKTEKKNGFGYAHKYLSEQGRQKDRVTVLKEGQQSRDFEVAVSA